MTARGLDVLVSRLSRLHVEHSSFRVCSSKPCSEVLNPLSEPCGSAVLTPFPARSQALVLLTVSGNKLTALPVSIGGCAALETLEAKDNQLTVRTHEGLDSPASSPARLVSGAW